MLPRLWILLHLVFAFSFVGSLVVAEWMGRAARATEDWGHRALLFGIASRSGRLAGLVPLLLAGLLGNLAAVATGRRMAEDVWLRWVNGLWLAAVLVMLAVTLPAASRLAALAGSGGAREGYTPALAKWRLGNAALGALYLALLVLMVWARPA